MDKDLHTINEIFNKAYREYEEEPSPATWEKLNARLDKEDADKYKKGFISWKRIAILLLLLLSGLVIYESRNIIKGRRGNGFAKKAHKKDSVSDKIKNTTIDAAIENKSKHEETKQKTASTITEQPITKQKETHGVGETPLKENNVTDNREKLLLYELNKKNYTDAHKQKLTPQRNKLVELKKKMIIVNRGGNILSSDKNKLKKTVISNDSLLNKTTTSETQAQRTLTMASVRRLANAKIAPIDIYIPKNRATFLSDSLIAKIFVTTINKNSWKYFKPYWSVTAFASNDWGQYELSNDAQNNNSNNQDEKEDINKREKHEASFSTGFLVTRQLTKKWGVKTGLIFSNTAIMIDPQEMYASQQADGKIAYKYITSSGYGYVKPGFGLPPVIGDSLQSAKAQHNLQTFSVPLLVTYRFDKKKISVIPSAGITANFITSATVQTEVTDALNREAVTINGLYGMSKFYIGFMGDVNLQYYYNKKWSFNLLPTFKYALTPITKSNVVKTHPYTFGIGAGITYKF